MGENKSFQQFRKPADQKSAGESQQEIRVVAIAAGYYDRARIEPGMELTIPPKAFSSVWMKKIETPE